MHWYWVAHSTFLKNCKELFSCVGYPWKITSCNTQDTHMYTKDKYWHGNPRIGKKVDFSYPWRRTEAGNIYIPIKVSRVSQRILLMMNAELYRYASITIKYFWTWWRLLGIEAFFFHLFIPSTQRAMILWIVLSRKVTISIASCCQKTTCIVYIIFRLHRDIICLTHSLSLPVGSFIV
jgi:hypothetical protein